LIRFGVFQAERICGDAFTQTIEKGCGKKSRWHCASEEIFFRNSESYCLTEQSDTFVPTMYHYLLHKAQENGIEQISHS